MGTSSKHHFRPIRPIAAALGLLLVGWLGLAWTVEQELLHPKRTSVTVSPGDLGLQYRDIAFDTRDGVRLSGWWIPGGGRATIVMIHGQNADREFLLARCAYLHVAGYNLLLFDLRGYGRSSGRVSTLGYLEAEDVRAAVTAAVREGSAPIVLLGYSMGATAAVRAASVDGRVRAVIDDGGYGDLVALQSTYGHRVGWVPTWAVEPALIALGRLDAGFDMRRIRADQAAARLTVPLLVLVGANDPSMSNQLSVYTSGPNSKKLIVFPGAGHLESYTREGQLYRSSVLSFLSAVFQ